MRLASAGVLASVALIAALLSPSGDRSTAAGPGKALIAEHGGRVTRDLHIINGFGAEMEAAKAASLATEMGVRSVSLNAAIKKTDDGYDGPRLATAYNQ